jgi:acyl carrier protein
VTARTRALKARLTEGLRRVVCAHWDVSDRPEPCPDLSDDDDLIALGLVDSLLMLEVLDYLEEELGDAVDLTALSRESFSSIACLIDSTLGSSAETSESR